MATLYLLQAGARLQCEQGQLVVTEGDVVRMRVPIEQVDHLVAHVRCQLNPGAIATCLREGIAIALLESNGQLLGRIEPRTGGHTALQRAQWMFMMRDDAVFALAKAFVVAKVRNQRAVLRRRLGDGFANDAWQRRVDGAVRADNLESLRGYEGAASASYFRELANTLPSEWAFERRTMHPALDAMSASLNFVYTLLRTRLNGAIAAVGLNPYLGVLHADRDGHAALTSDLMEEWRPAVADRLVLDAIDCHALRLDDFETADDGSVRLGQTNLRHLISLWEQRLERNVTLPALNQSLPLRVAFLQQALHLGRHMKDATNEVYKPWRVH
jgi:CRISPR-associated protein Cas1